MLYTVAAGRMLQLYMRGKETQGHNPVTIQLFNVLIYSHANINKLLYALSSPMNRFLQYVVNVTAFDGKNRLAIVGLQ